SVSCSRTKGTKSSLREAALRLIEHPECELPLCSINLSAASLKEDFVPFVREQLTEHRLPPEGLCFEITEAAALGNLAHTVSLISQIRATGCGVTLEDFGNGLTSFAYL